MITRVDDSSMGKRTSVIMALTMGIVAALTGGVIVWTAAPARAATLAEITDFGENPTQLEMYVYAPNTLVENPPVVVAVHYCHGDATSFYNGSQFASLAESYGFLLIFPSVTQASDGCFDVSSEETLTHGAGGDSLGIVSMVEYAVEHYGADASRVYATGVSSGAMMTNVLLGAYPDVFAAGSAFAGVPFGCFAVDPDSLGWSTACATGTVVRTGEEWGDVVRAAYPDYTGVRPRIQLWHGTADETLNYVNFGEEIKQWTDVLGVSQTPVSTETDTPAEGQTRTSYGDSEDSVVVEAISLDGVSHNLPVNAAEAIAFFELDTDLPSASPTSVAPGTCSAAVSTASRWSTGFVASVTVTAGGSAVDGWAVTLTLASGTTITSLWNGTVTGDGTSVTVSNQSYNGSLSAGESTTFGFQASGTDDAVAAVCAVA